MKKPSLDEMNFIDQVFNCPEVIKMRAESVGEINRQIEEIERLLKDTPAESPAS